MGLKGITNSTCNWTASPIFPESYLVSDCGDVYSIRTKRMLKPNKDKSGYLYFVLCVNGTRKTVKAHRLVGMAFIENTYNKPTINHINGIRTDNRVGNLEWATAKEQKHTLITEDNMKRVWANTNYRDMGAKRNFGRIPVTVTFNDGTAIQYESVLAASKAMRKSYSKMSEMLSGKRKMPSGFCIAATKNFPERSNNG